MSFVYSYILIMSFAVLSDPDKRLEYDFTGIYEIDKYTLRVRTCFLSHFLYHFILNLKLYATISSIIINSFFF